MPKRSSGCFGCRQRKVRCDETKPECNGCRRRGVRCQGYRPEGAFIIHLFESCDKPSVVHEDDNIYRLDNQEQEQSSGERSSTLGLESSREISQEPPMPRQVSPVKVERVKYLENFLRLYLPQYEGEAITPPSALIRSLPDTPATREVFLASMDALSAAQLAVSRKVDEKNHELINRCRSLYSTALARMYKTVARNNYLQEDQTLLAAYLLALYEIFVGITNGQGFFYHFQGCLHLLNLRGPSSLQTPLSIRLFHGIRYYSLAIGYHVRKASILDTPAWLAVTSRLSEPEPWISLMDLCICIPRLLHRTDKLEQNAGTPEQFDKLIVDSRLLADRLFEWFAIYEKNGPLYEVVPVASMDSFFKVYHDLLYHDAFAFRTFSALTIYLLYWMSMLIARSNTFRLDQKHRELDLKQLHDWDHELSGYAENICRSVPFGCSRKAGYTGRFSTMTPLMVAKKYYEVKGATKEATWCEKAYFGTKVPGLYTPPVPIEPLQSMVALVQSDRYI
ncbi:hypothetical protein BDV96DRAFT_617014 [Lophiotrema nucula]|uniref:Zn(2)-C6 fungal-type domain-containing protein n=1 Tax=Lophiotrema nucula TaxID=690887 RepID=A0A6A5YIY7_9PLEO|nr:hypothetical protein BDV96DRAFT_617014 [Lophiotrema nucula]